MKPQRIRQPTRPMLSGHLPGRSNRGVGVSRVWGTCPSGHRPSVLSVFRMPRKESDEGVHPNCLTRRTIVLSWTMLQSTQMIRNPGSYPGQVSHHWDSEHGAMHMVGNTVANLSQGCSPKATTLPAPALTKRIHTSWAPTRLNTSV